MDSALINIRDPFVLTENGKYYMYGTRAVDFGRKTGGFDVYVSQDLNEWNGPFPCFDSEKYGLNREVNWAPEVHKYNGKYFMFASFTRENGLRGTYALSSQSPLGPFCPRSKGALTPKAWECIDGTFTVKTECLILFSAMSIHRRLTARYAICLYRRILKRAQVRQGLYLLRPRRNGRIKRRPASIMLQTALLCTAQKAVNFL